MKFEPRPPDLDRLKKPGRLYAYLEEVFPEKPGPDDRCTAIFDAVDAEWVDNGDDILSFGAETPTSIIAVEMPFSVLGPRPETGGDWWEIDLHQEKLRADHYASLFHLPMERRVGYPQSLDRARSERLSRSTGLDRYRDATEDEIRAALSGVNAADDVAAIDIGHGNCNAVCEDGVVSAYYDFGGGVLWNVRTYPPNIAFCYGRKPPVVLSHWDWDHWASGALHPEALTLDWIVPRQAFKGPSHTAFATLLAAGNHLLIWPSSLSSVTQGSLEVVKCHGVSRNDSGLAAYVRDPRNSDHRILLSGDAAYPDIPGAMPADLSSLVVSHHGGNRSAPGVPPPRTKAHKLAYSWGNPNRYCHPTPANESEHRSAGWALDAHTADRGSPRGHVRLPSAPPRPRKCSKSACCGTPCTLDLTK